MSAQTYIPVQRQMPEERQESIDRALHAYNKLWLVIHQQFDAMQELQLKYNFEGFVDLQVTTKGLQAYRAIEDARDAMKGFTAQLELHDSHRHLNDRIEPTPQEFYHRKDIDNEERMRIFNRDIQNVDPDRKPSTGWPPSRTEPARVNAVTQVVLTDEQVKRIAKTMADYIQTRTQLGDL